MSILYPKNPRFNPLKMRSSDYKTWQEGCVQSPSVIYEDGKYYAFSNDSFGAPSGYQVRCSEDLMHWEYIGSAFSLEGTQSAYKNGTATSTCGKFQPAYNWCVTDTKEVGYGICTRTDGSMSFWNPHVIKGKDGKFWLYFSLTGYFGGSKSCIGLAKSDRVDGGYEFVGLILRSVGGWVSPNAIDPYAFYDKDGKLYLVYGSYGMGIYIIELNAETGLRKDGLTYEKFRAKTASFKDYYGVQLATGTVEGGAIVYHEGVEVIENGNAIKKNFYYFVCSYGSLSSAYSIRMGRSENVLGPYTDVNGNTLVCSTDIGTGNKLMGSYKWSGTNLDYYCPGQVDFVTSAHGKNLMAYHCRTNYFINQGLSRSNNFHYLYVNQYDFNSDGWIVMNPNRYALERLCDVTKEELLSVSSGRFEMVVFTQGVVPVQAQRVTLNEDGTISGYYTGVWKMYGGRYISIITDGEEYHGTVMPAWQDTQKNAGITVSALGLHCGMALYLNSNPKLMVN